MALNDFKETLIQNFSQKKVLVTGNTGFKGAWLSHWLVSLGAEVAGFANQERTRPNMHEELNLAERTTQYIGDISDFDAISDAISEFKPDFIFHLAAQSLVTESVKNPLATFRTNTLGTITILEAMRVNSFQGVAVIITSDKCYENLERHEGYVETDRMGGKDPYSASKGAAELAISSYLRTYPNAFPRIAIGRAGNVIGGGDWNSNRIIVDCVRAWERNEAVILRSPNSTRPWQHVLEPLSGYLALAIELNNKNSVSKQAFNFGPDTEKHYTVREVVDLLQNEWPSSPGYTVAEESFERENLEAKLLALNCEKAKNLLNWRSTLSLQETVKLISDWYLARIQSKDLQQITSNQIDYFTARFKNVKLR
jgi:CDP-glucose 4,6-dehydratase